MVSDSHWAHDDNSKQKSEHKGKEQTNCLSMSYKIFPEVPPTSFVYILKLQERLGYIVS